MAWSTTANPDRFEEAVAWFLRRVLLTDSEYRELVSRARRRAFWVARVEPLDVVESVFKSLTEAIANGTPRGEWQKSVRGMLLREWQGSVKRPAQRLELIYRNAVQHAYNAGRWQQLQHPALVRYRPYLMFDSILDSRTSEICRPLNNTVLPRDDPWWETHFPPLHHACRSSVRALTKKQAARKGIAEGPPEDEHGHPVEAQKGFGGTPGAAEWQPTKADYPPELWREFERKNERAGGAPEQT